MTSRERVTKFLNREPVDRIPNGWGGCETAGLHNLAYAKLKNVLGVEDPNNKVCTFMNNAVFEPSVIDAMEGDLILLASYMCPSRFWGPNAASEWKDLHIWDTTIQVAKDWEFRKDPDGTWWWDESTEHAPGALLKCAPGSLYFDSPPGEAGDYFGADTEAPSPDTFNPSHEIPEEQLRRLEEDAKFLSETTDYAIVCGERLRDLQLRPGGTTGWWMMMVENPDACHEYLNKAVDAALDQLKMLDQAIGKYCCMLQIADDIGDTRGITIGPDLWRQIFKPHYMRLFSEWHKITDMKVSLHCCGSTVDILDDLIECGVDIYNPVQISANRMDPTFLKENWGDKIIFYGGVYDTPLMPPDMPEDEVYARVKKNIEAFSRGGGYMFAGVHNLPGDIPEGHLKAMLQAWKDVREMPELL